MVDTVQLVVPLFTVRRIMRMVLLKVSATNRFPLGSNATAPGP